MPSSPETDLLLTNYYLLSTIYYSEDLDGLAASTSGRSTGSGSSGTGANRSTCASVPSSRCRSWMLLLVVVPCVALIVWLYRREGSASIPYKMFLAGLRISLVLLALFMLSEAVLSVDRTGLPYFVVMVDDSASQQVVDQLCRPQNQGRRDRSGQDRRPRRARPPGPGSRAVESGRRGDPPRACRRSIGSASIWSPRRPAPWPRSTSPRRSPRRWKSSRRLRPAATNRGWGQVSARS